MKFFLPDSQDLVDPSFDFETERRSEIRIRQRDDLYAHEIFSARAFDGLLVSKGIVDGFGDVGSRYSLGQRHRLLRNGAKSFFRLPTDRPMPVLGDCGAFTYVGEDVPPYSVDDVISFYVDCGFDMGISVDHVILEYQPEWDEPGAKPDPKVRERQKITLDLASQFLKRQRSSKLPFEPLGVAQGWSPKSYAHAVKELQQMGYRYIALGGMVPLKTAEILDSLAAIEEVRHDNVKLHLLGVTRIDHLTKFERFGVASFDSTSPLRQAFKDDSNNYYTANPKKAYTAIRIPQVDGNPRLQRLISSGAVSQDRARLLEKAALKAMKEFDAELLDLESVLSALNEYETLCNTTPVSGKPVGRRGAKSHDARYRDVLEAKPWKNCACEVCQSIGYHVILFRGAERNRRRGFHNVWTFYRQLKREFGLPVEEVAA